MNKGVKTATVILLGAITVSLSLSKNKREKEIRKYKERDVKNDAILNVYSQWMELKRKGKNIDDYLKQNGYQKIAIYGMHYLGANLYEELKNSDVEIKYAIDRNANNIVSDIPLYTPEEVWEEVDAVIVTAFHFYDEIELELGRQICCPIISLKDILLEMNDTKN